jgi:hypothetical protein
MGISVHRIDAVNDRDHVVALRRGRKDDILGSRLNVFFEILPFSEYTCALKQDIHRQAGPRQISWILFAEVADCLLPDDQVYFVPLHGLVISAIHSIVL